MGEEGRKLKLNSISKPVLFFYYYYFYFLFFYKCVFFIFYFFGVSPSHRRGKAREGLNPGGGFMDILVVWVPCWVVWERLVLGISWIHMDSWINGLMD